MTAASVRTMRRVAAAAAVAIATLAAFAAGDTAVAALFSSSASAPTGSFSSATLQPVSNLSVTWWCPSGHGVGAGSGVSGYTATVAWDASPSGFVQAYVVEWAPSSGGPWTELSTTSSTAVQQTSVGKKTERWWRVTSAAHEWRSAPALVSGTSPNANC
jgi:hypothetical protein